MSAPAPPAPTPLAPAAPGTGRGDDGLGIADLVTLLGLETAADPADDAPDGARSPREAVAVVRAWVRRAADWGSGPQRSWCAW
ncbi:hypothetical protein SAMN04488107_0085 [Geodermatophilus saharensis]|uniref:Uncharacterized protein n=1 Tax=Geodermatophilus saharensis TaxID=1137994 RepID=A0A238ZJ18_9ACTN|nr:hypothetical protein [Geodermatophilus saharensis]SNR82704.1 hypothetical protein SAMN04488107_0085 [Geodermatophilus saharensis]